jgi:hypothetical protein
MVIVAVRALDLEYLVKILHWGRSRSRYILPTPTPPKIPADSDSTALVAGWNIKEFVCSFASNSWIKVGYTGMQVDRTDVSCELSWFGRGNEYSGTRALPQVQEMHWLADRALHGPKFYNFTWASVRRSCPPPTPPTPVGRYQHVCYTFVKDPQPHFIQARLKYSYLRSAVPMVSLTQSSFL